MSTLPGGKYKKTVSCNCRKATSWITYSCYSSKSVYHDSIPYDCKVSCHFFIVLILLNCAGIQGFPMLMEGHCSMDLRRLYTLLSRVDAINSLSQALSSYIRVDKRGIATDMQNGEDMLSSLSELKSLLDSIWEESFSKDQLLKKTIDDTFKDLVNLCQVS